MISNEDDQKQRWLHHNIVGGSADYISRKTFVDPQSSDLCNNSALLVVQDDVPGGF